MSGIVKKLVEAQKKTDERKQLLRWLVGMISGLLATNAEATRFASLRFENSKKIGMEAVYSLSACRFNWRLVCQADGSIKIFAYTLKYLRHLQLPEQISSLSPDEAKDICCEESLDAFVEWVREIFPMINESLERFLSTAEE